MKVAYLVNQYPKTTHSFIRREIIALERQGVSIARVSVRRPEGELPDPADQREATRTRLILEEGVPRLLAAALRIALTRPRAFLAAVRRTLALGMSSDSGVLRHFAYLVEACWLVEWCRAQQVDHLHAHFGTNPAAVALLGRVLGGPGYSFTVHGPEEFERAAHLGLGEKIAAARFVVAISELGRQQLRHWAGDAGTPIHVVRCGVDEALLSHPPVAVPAAWRLVCIGRLCEQKGQLHLLAAAQQLVASGAAFELVLVGDGPLRPVIADRIQELGLSRCVTLVGWADSAAVREQILAARALVLSSVAEGLPVVLMEALALHRPVIATRIAGIPELVDDSCGWLVPPQEPAALAGAMRAALQASPDRLAEMGRAGAARVREQHDVGKEARRLAELFCAQQR